jgi:hypothetical protein
MQVLTKLDGLNNTSTILLFQMLHLQQATMRGLIDLYASMSVDDGRRSASIASKK